MAPVAEQYLIRRGVYPNAGAQFIVPEEESEKTQDARKRIILLLKPVYELAMREAHLSRETLGRLNAFRHSQEFK